jgi:hypothetical protein
VRCQKRDAFGWITRGLGFDFAEDVVEGREEGGGGRYLVLSDFPGEGKRDMRRRRRRIHDTCRVAGYC